MSGASIPSKDYRRQYAPWVDELLSEWRRVLLEESPVLGPSLSAFEDDFARYLGARRVVGVNSGTDALSLALRVLGIGRGDQVITAANTFFATVSAIRMTGATPVLVDPDPLTMNVDEDAMAAAVSSSTAALLPVHLYGRSAPLPALEHLAERHGLALVEDAAQAHGARDAAGRRVGSVGACGAFSFHPSKNLGAFGDGGAIALADEALGERLDVLRNLGKRSGHAVDEVAPNTKLDTLQAALLRIKLPRLDESNERRCRLAARYRAGLSGVGDLLLPDDPGSGQHVFHLYVVRSQHRDALRAQLLSQGIRASLHYPIAPHRQQADLGIALGPGGCPVAEELADTVLSLPIAPELDEVEIDRVVEAVRGFFAGTRP